MKKSKDNSSCSVDATSTNGKQYSPVNALRSNVKWRLKKFVEGVHIAAGSQGNLLSEDRGVIVK